MCVFIFKARQQAVSEARRRGITLSVSLKTGADAAGDKGNIFRPPALPFVSS